MLICITLNWQLSGLPNEKEAVYGALNKWVAWEVEFPIIAAAKALQILRKRSQWHRVIQVSNTTSYVKCKVLLNMVP